MKHRLALGLALLVASGSLVAFAAPAKAPYLGTWTAHLSRAQMINEGFDVRLAGTFRLVLRPNGTYTTFNAFDGASRGTFKVSGRKILFAKDVLCIEGGFEGEGAYTWALSNGRLRLAQVRVGSDPCGARWQTLTYPVWKKYERSER
jgi:hypothetical protein